MGADEKNRDEMTWQNKTLVIRITIKEMVTRK